MYTPCSGQPWFARWVLVYPFCTYNSSPGFREKIEKQFSVPLDLKAAKPSPSNGNGNGLVNVT